ncbi:tripartite tricarboxylate transporter TctB family protein [Salinicola rhizosphaerae]|uniref:Membrane protein n=1 Tax=Salinicola rhizosphaerae TaxID=1443141 RepID=A0ABQ3EE83_9GAMM|nr:tripartite tricarboxylate transporter TctB family protein [Salinicola rhizosphaerae]GHB31952.1 membrane protein [Salinicola rhizosphaerae]
MNLAADRILSLLLLGLAAFIAVQAWHLDVPFSYDPVGPKAFPLILSALLAILAVVLFVRPGPSGQWPSGALLLRLLFTLVLLFVYAALFVDLGFLATTAIVSVAIAWLFGATPLKALIGGVLLAAGSYLLFTYALGISLPTGSWIEPLLGAN